MPVSLLKGQHLSLAWGSKKNLDWQTSIESAIHVEKRFEQRQQNCLKLSPDVPGIQPSDAGLIPQLPLLATWE